MRNSVRTLVYVAHAGDTSFISYGHPTIRWHTLVYVVIRRTICQRIAYTVDIRYSYTTCTLCKRSRTLHECYSHVHIRRSPLEACVAFV